VIAARVVLHLVGCRANLTYISGFPVRSHRRIHIRNGIGIGRKSCPWSIHDDELSTCSISQERKNKRYTITDETGSPAGDQSSSGARRRRQRRQGAFRQGGSLVSGGFRTPPTSRLVVAARTQPVHGHARAWYCARRRCCHCHCAGAHRVLSQQSRSCTPRALRSRRRIR
jgi:hypothetical protein